MSYVTKVAPDAIKVAPGISTLHPSRVSISHPNGALAVNRSLTITAKDAELLREFVKFAVESINAIIATEEKLGNRQPIVDQLREYASVGTDLLARIGASK